MGTYTIKMPDVGEGVAEAELVADAHRLEIGLRGEDELGTALGHLLTEEVADERGRVDGVERIALQAAAVALDAREVEDLVDDVDERGGGAVDRLDGLALLVVEVRHPEQGSGADDHVHGRPELAARARQEDRFCPVRGADGVELGLHRGGVLLGADTGGALRGET